MELLFDNAHHSNKRVQSVPVLGNSVSHLFPSFLLFYHPGSSLCCPPNSHAVLHLCCNRDAGTVVYIHENLNQNMTGEPLLQGYVWPWVSRLSHPEFENRLAESFDDTSLFAFRCLGK